MVVSWIPAFNIREENPYLIQANPGLSAHADAITNYISLTWPGKKVYVVSRNNATEANRAAMFKKISN